MNGQYVASFETFASTGVWGVFPTQQEAEEWLCRYLSGLLRREHGIFSSAGDTYDEVYAAYDEVMHDEVTVSIVRIGDYKELPL